MFKKSRFLLPIIITVTILVFFVFGFFLFQNKSFDKNKESKFSSTVSSPNSNFSVSTSISDSNQSKINLSNQNSQSFQNSKNLPSSANFSTENVAISQNSSQSWQETLKKEKLNLENLSQTLIKIDLKSKPFLLTEEELLDQNRQSLLPKSQKDYRFKNLKPIFAEKTLYFPYATGFIAKVNLENGQVIWDKFDFLISQMSLFNGSYYLTEFKENCNNSTEKCRILEINRNNISNQKTLIEVNNSNQFVAFTDSKNFWLTEGLRSGGEMSYTQINKYSNLGQFIEGFGNFIFLSYTETSKAGPNCANRYIVQTLKNPDSENFNPKNDEKKIWESPYNNCKTMEDQQNAKKDQTGEKIFQAKFPFDISKLITLEQKEPISCGKWQYKTKNSENNNYFFQLFYDNQEILNFPSTPISCI